VLEANAQDASPLALLEKTRERTFGGGAAGAVGQLQKLVKPAAYQCGKGMAQEIGGAAIDGENFALERNGKEQVLEGID
jgi:hypothetical protein